MATLVKIVTLFFLAAAMMAEANIRDLNSGEGRKVNLKKIKVELEKNAKHLRQIKNKIESLEGDLGKGNKRYLKISRSKQKIESQIGILRKKLDESSEELNREVIESQEMLASVLSNTLNTEEGSAEILTRKLLIKGLRKRLTTLKEHQKRGKELSGRLDDHLARYHEYIKSESEILTLIHELEERKRAYASDFMTLTESKDNLQAKFDQLRSKIARGKKSRALKEKFGEFGAPIAEYSGLDFGNKGVSFSFRGRKPVVSTRSGRIAYSGSLSTYGNVIMIDHGKQTRSVILGQFDPKVSKGATVRKGDVIGYTRIKSKNEGKVYFEVRKHNKVQKTIHLLDRASLAQNAKAGQKG